VSQENNKIVENIDSLMVNGAAEEHYISVDEDSGMKVWVKELTFLEAQGAVKEFMDINPQTGDMSMDLGAYWKYMLMHSIDRTEPKMSKAQILSLKPSILSQITGLLPQPQDVVGGPLVGMTE
tara:strand:- start:343 stop:711 length:369 start_codon:yes stop_codon:yes gene_type:complete